MTKITLTGQLIQYLFTGVTVGSIYAMVAVGFNIIYNVTEIINFAQGEFVMLGDSCGGHWRGGADGALYH
jgi:branched-chain amino acid transport system permease protein